MRNYSVKLYSSNNMSRMALLNRLLTKRNIHYEIVNDTEEVKDFCNEFNIISSNELPAFLLSSIENDDSIVYRYEDGLNWLAQYIGKENKENE